VDPRADLDAVAKIRISCRYRESISGRPARSPVTTPTELPRLSHRGEQRLFMTTQTRNYEVSAESERIKGR
jgi:hypothetical protein